MKTKSTSKRKQSASALLVTLFICAILGVSTLGYLTLVEQQNSLSFRSQAWNLSMTLVESGIEEGLEHLNSEPNDLATQGWVYNGTGYSKTNTLAVGGYIVTIYTQSPYGTSEQPSIIAQATVQPRQLAKVRSATFFATIGVEAEPTTVSRAVRVHCSRGPSFTKGIASKGPIDMNGNGVTVDSFNSAVTGPYTSGTARRSKGDVASNATIVNAVDVGNANIYGHVSTGPSGTIYVGHNGAIGDVDWQSSHSGIQDGWSDSTSNFTFPETSLPSDYTSYATPTSGYVTNTTYVIDTNSVTVTILPNPIPAGTITNRIKINGDWVYLYTYPTYSSNAVTTVDYYDHILVGGNNYQASSLGGKTIVLPGSGSGVTLVLPNGLSMSGSDEFTIAQNASVTVYSGGTSCNIGGNGVINQAGYAQDFILYCAPTVKSFGLSGNGSFTGVFVGPSVDLSLNGGGNNTLDFVGALLVNSLTLNGHFNIHYDEALGTLPAGGRFLATSWDEIPVTSLP